IVFFDPRGEVQKCAGEPFEGVVIGMGESGGNQSTDARCWFDQHDRLAIVCGRQCCGNAAGCAAVDEYGAGGWLVGKGVVEAGEEEAKGEKNAVDHFSLER